METHQSHIPEWLPPFMRHTATAPERLHSLLVSLLPSLESENELFVRARAWKIQHLCMQIDADACTGPAAPLPTFDEACHIVEIATGFLENKHETGQIPEPLIYAIHQAAFSLMRLGSPNAHGNASREFASRARAPRGLRENSRSSR